MLATVLIATFLTFVASYVSKTPCVGEPHDEAGYSVHIENSYRLACLTDIQALWGGRGIDTDTFPYVHGGWEPGGGPPGELVDGAIEYPVLTGLVMWLAGLPAGTSSEFLHWTALLLFPVALLIGWQLTALAGRRALIWAAAPAVVFYSIYNWDLLPIAWTLGAVLAWRHRRWALAGACLGLGAATKIYPGFFLLPLVIERLVARDRRGALTVAGAGAGSWLAANLPFILVNFDGWWATYKFQSHRIGDISTNSVYFWGFPGWSPEVVDLLSTGVIAVGWIVALVLGWRWRPAADRYPWIAVSAAMLCAFLAFNKVYSPQYFLWVLPFLALLEVRWGWWVAYWAIDATLFLGLMRWYHDQDHELARQAVVIGVWGKTVILSLLVVALLRARLTEGADPDRADDSADGPAAPPRRSAGGRRPVARVP